MLPEYLATLIARIRAAGPSEDTIELMAGASLMAEAIDRALNACPFCRAGTCTAEAHAWLKDASGWAFAKGRPHTSPRETP